MKKVNFIESKIEDILKKYRVNILTIYWSQDTKIRII